MSFFLHIQTQYEQTDRWTNSVQRRCNSSSSSTQSNCVQKDLASAGVG